MGTLQNGSNRLFRPRLLQRREAQRASTCAFRGIISIRTDRNVYPRATSWLNAQKKPHIGCSAHFGLITCRLNTALEALAEGFLKLPSQLLFIQPCVAARIAEKKNRTVCNTLKELNDPAVLFFLTRYSPTSNLSRTALNCQKVIAETNGLSKAATSGTSFRDYS